MPLIAIKKDKDYLRIAVASGSKTSGRLQFERALSVELAGETEPLSAARLGDKLQAVLEKIGAQRGDATFIVARSDVEMGQFQLPLVPDDELPDVVRFQARNHFTSITEESIVDFVVLSKTDKNISVLAAVLTGEALQRIHDTLAPTGLKLKHIVVRPFAAAELLHTGNSDKGCRVIIEIIGREADISVVHNDKIVLSRTVRVPESYTVEKFDAWLPGEIRRTITAAQGQVGAEEVQSIVVCGSANEHEQLCQDLEKSFQIKSHFVKPFDLVQKSSRFETPTRNDGFASLLGSLLRTSGESNRGLDFVNPRKRVAKKLDKKKLYRIAGVAAAILILGVTSVWWILGSKQAEITSLQNAINEIKPYADQNKGAIQNAEIIDQWKSRQIDWLEELYKLSNTIPEPDNTRLLRLTARANRTDTASIELVGLLKDASIRNVKETLEARPYRVEPKKVTPSDEGGFEQQYTVSLFFPFSEIMPNGTVVTFDDKLAAEIEKAAKQQSNETKAAPESELDIDTGKADPRAE